MKIFDTVTQLKKAKLTVGQLVQTQGYYAAGDGGGAAYIIAATQTVDGYGDHALANGNVALLQDGGVAIARQFGAKGDGVTDDAIALDALKDSRFKSILLGREGDTFVRSTPWRFDLADSGIRLDFGGAVLQSTSRFGIYIPAVGDPFDSVAGATDLTIIAAALDGQNSAATSVGIISYNATNLRVDRPNLYGWSTSGSIIYGLSAGSCNVFYSNVIAHSNGNHGLAVSTVEVDASRVIIDGVQSYSNGLGVDISTGSATVSNVIAWNNTNGGMKTAGNDEQHLLLSNADLSNNTAGGAQGFYTNGTFKLIEMSNVRCNNNGNTGIQIAHSGVVLASNVSCEGNGGIGYYQSGSADATITSLLSSRNGSRGVLVGAGNCQLGSVRTQLNERVGVLISTLGTATVESHLSIDDCTVSDNNALFCQPASGEGRYSIASVQAIDTGGSGGVVTAVSLNTQTTQAAIGSIQTVGAGITAPISDSGTSNSYINANGRAQMPFERIGFYGANPLSKQTITGSKGGNSALTDLLVKLSGLGLITDSTT